MSCVANIVNFGQGAADASLMVQSALGQRLHLAGLILSSSMSYPTGPIETIGPDTWHETLQTTLLGPISLIQSFLPLVIPSEDCKLTIAPFSTRIKDHLPHPFHRPFFASALQWPQCSDLLGSLLPRPHPRPRTPHNPCRPNQSRNL